MSAMKYFSAAQQTTCVPLAAILNCVYVFYDDFS